MCAGPVALLLCASPERVTLPRIQTRLHEAMLRAACCVIESFDDLVLVVLLARNASGIRPKFKFFYDLKPSSQPHHVAMPLKQASSQPYRGFAFSAHTASKRSVLGSYDRIIRIFTLQNIASRFISRLMHNL